MKKMIKKYVNVFLYERRVLKNRYLDSVNDLNKSYPNLDTFVSNQQKTEIMDFWGKYLVGKYAKKYFDIRWFDVYNSVNNGDYDLRLYIPDGFYYCIVDTYFSNHEACYIMDDKNFYDLYFPEITRPKTIIRKESGCFFDANWALLSLNEALDKCSQNSKIIIKPSISSCGGRGIDYWNPSEMNIDDLKRILNQHDSVVVQECVIPHKLFQKINKDCLSTLRIVTLLFEGQVHVVSSVIIMGGQGAKTNHLHSGGLVCGIHENGKLKNKAYDGHGNSYEEHPNGVIFGETFIPGYHECVQYAKLLAPRMCRVTKLIGWDFTIGQNGEPMLIEANLTWGGLCQIANGPIFGELTERVLNEVVSNSFLFK